jgi:hypothetical protein
VTLNAVALVAADAGKGGDGGEGQLGGSGGDGGKAGYGGAAADSCPGGQGGKGGKGGSGGGAAGGVSVGIVWSGDAAPSYDAASTFSLGNPGAKGIGGDAGQNDGIAGVSQDELEVP